MRRATPSADPDDLNQPADTYVALTNRPVERAEIRPLNGVEIEEFGQIVGTTGVRVRIRYREDLTTDSIIRVDSVSTPYYLSVKSIPADTDGKRMYVWFVAVREEVPA